MKAFAKYSVVVRSRLVWVARLIDNGQGLGAGVGMRLGLIGATGWLGTALGTRVLQGGWPELAMTLLNRSAPRGAYDPWPGVAWASDAATLCARSDVLVLSTRPEDFPQPGFDGTAKLVISFMTAWSLDRLAALCPGARIVRAMPNGAASEGRSFTPWVAGPGLGADDFAVVRRLLAAMGEEAEVKTEAELDYLSALSGSGSAYPALLAQAMLADALSRGLPQAVAERAVASVLASGGALAGDLAQVDSMLDTYLGYRGVTAAGLNAAVAAGFAKAVTAALAAADAKARTLTAKGIAP